MNGQSSFDQVLRASIPSAIVLAYCAYIRSRGPKTSEAREEDRLIWNTLFHKTSLKQLYI